jgi:hypothetical protein
MNSEPAPERTGLAYVIAILGAFLIVAGLVWAMRHYSQPPALGEDRAKVRAKALAELREDEADKLQNPGWVDPTKGLVRLPIAVAMKMVERDWGQNPAAARSNLVERVEKANVAPPKAPEKPSPFE